ncbi:segregation and condensation protein B [Archaeoglobus sulfaticallidus PM70-1]|uniref:Segregation and condensation protein B n=1 Tax=Archaeoglobus sulfaticallidus PM70-1 TaxID=387631 RepID=N0BET0_9EURY|nr:SMC-Scp complex subunit ScpB [Archaeoglobus sulfaticallidus]AGK60782.1 segregation and condensation protein B [Archaeoglobus sulfaticallidus PM70-1]
MEDKNENEVRKIVEAILFSSSEPISPSKIARIVRVKTEIVEKVLRDLVHEYNIRDSSIEIIELKGSYLMRVKPNYTRFVDRFSEKDLDRGTRRTLVVIAIRQPIKLSELAKIRGNRCYEHVKKLEEIGFIETRKEGRSKIITTTKYFAKYYGLEKSDPEYVREFFSELQKKGKLSDYSRE